jgi:exodeoxyribonuclease VII small subunit
MSKSRSTPAPEPAAPLPETYEAAVVELEQLVSRLDAGQLPLDQLLSQYQRGAQLLDFCQRRLKSVEDQIKVMDNGKLTTWVPN